MFIILYKMCRIPDLPKLFASVCIVKKPVEEKPLMSDHVPAARDTLVIAFKVGTPQVLGTCMGLP